MDASKQILTRHQTGSACCLRSPLDRYHPLKVVNWVESRRGLLRTAIREGASYGVSRNPV